MVEQVYDERGLRGHLECVLAPLLLLWWPAREGPYPREELGEVEGFGQVDVSPSIQVFDLGACRGHQDWDANVSRPEPLDDLDSPLFPTSTQAALRDLFSSRVAFLALTRS